LSKIQVNYTDSDYTPHHHQRIPSIKLWSIKSSSSTITDGGPKYCSNIITYIPFITECNRIWWYIFQWNPYLHMYIFKIPRIPSNHTDILMAQIQQWRITLNQLENIKKNHHKTWPARMAFIQKVHSCKSVKS
jgi:hypothetical protein